MKTVNFNKNCGFWSENCRFDENCGFWSENCGFQADLSSETAKITFPTQPSTGQHQTLKYIDFSVK